MLYKYYTLVPMFHEGNDRTFQPEEMHSIKKDTVVLRRIRHITVKTNKNRQGSVIAYCISQSNFQEVEWTEKK